MDPNDVQSTDALETPSLETGSLDSTYMVLAENATSDPTEQKKEYISSSSFWQSAFENDTYYQIIGDFVYDVVLGLQAFGQIDSAYDQQYHELLSDRQLEDFFDEVLTYRYGPVVAGWTYAEKQAAALADQRLRDLLADNLAQYGETYFDSLITVYLMNTTATERHAALVYLFEVPMPNGQVYHKYTIEAIGGLEVTGDIADPILLMLGATAGGGTGVAAGTPGGPAGWVGVGALGTAGGLTAGAAASAFVQMDVGASGTFVRIRYNTVAADGVGGYDEGADPAYEFAWEVVALMVKGQGTAGVGMDFWLAPISVNIITPGDSSSDINSDTLYSNEYLPPSFFCYSVFWEAATMNIGGGALVGSMNIKFDELSTLGFYNFELEKTLSGGAGGMDLSVGTSGLGVFGLELLDVGLGLSIPVERLFDTAITESTVDQLHESDEGSEFAMDAVIGFPTNGTTLSADDIRAINQVIWQMFVQAIENNDSWPGYTVKITGSHSMLGGEGDSNTWLAKDRAQAVFDMFMQIIQSAEYQVLYAAYFPDYLDYVVIEPPTYLRPDSSKPSFDNSAIDRVGYVQVRGFGL